MARAAWPTGRRHGDRRGSLCLAQVRGRPRLQAEVRLPRGQHPIRLPGAPGEQYRHCDREARGIVGWPRVVKVHPVPCRGAVRKVAAGGARARALADKERLPSLQVDEGTAIEIQPFHSRSIYSANSTLSFTHMNGDVPLTTSPYHDDGQRGRLDLIRSKLPGVEEVVGCVPPLAPHRAYV